MNVRTGIKRYSFLFLLGCIAMQAKSDESFNWLRCGGPPGGLGYDIRYRFDDPNIWYVTDNFAGMFRSTDNGQTWQPANNGILTSGGGTGDAVSVFCLTVDPHNPQILWSGSEHTGNIYKSVDGGDSWTVKKNGIAMDYPCTITFRGFTVHPNTSDIVYAMCEISDPIIGSAVWGPGTGGAVFKTVDGGENWTCIWDGGIPSSLCRYMWINPKDPDILYVSTGIFDRGAIGEPEDPENNAHPFGGLGILKSTDGGATWDTLDTDNGLNFLYVGSLYMHPDNPDLLLAATGHITPAPAVDEMDISGFNPLGLYKTTDGGESWDHVLQPDEGHPGGTFTAVEIHPVYKNIAFAGSEAAIYCSHDTGSTWIQMTESKTNWGPPGIVAGWPIDLQCDPRDSLRIFANNYNGGNFLSEDGGKTWKNASQGYTGCQSRGVSVDPFNAARIFEAGRSGLWKSDNGGETWNGIFYLPEEEDGVQGLEWLSIACDPHQEGHVLAGQAVVLETHDGGKSWDVVYRIDGMNENAPAGTPYQPVIAFAFAPSDANRVYAASCGDGLVMGHERGDFGGAAAGGGGILRSLDGGTHWEPAVDESWKGVNVVDIAVDPQNALKVYAATPMGLYRTEDGGDNWNLMSTPSDTSFVRAVAVNPQNADYLVIAMEGFGIYVSTNGGTDWQIGYTGLEPNGSVHDIVIDPTNGNIAYATDFRSGIYRSEDGGYSWVRINQGLLNRSALSLTLSSDGQHLYTATDGAGIFRMDLNGIPAEVTQNHASPQTFSLGQNYPNPFNPQTTISFNVKKMCHVNLDIYNLRGQHVATLVDGLKPAGQYKVPFDASGLASGIYFYRIRMGDASAGSGEKFVAVRKMVVLE